MNLKTDDLNKYNADFFFFCRLMVWKTAEKIERKKKEKKKREAFLLIPLRQAYVVFLFSFLFFFSNKNK